MSSTILLNTIGIIVALGIAIVTYFKWSYSYWRRRNLPFLEPKYWYGTLENPFRLKNDVGVQLQKNYMDLKQRGLKHGGIFNLSLPCYMPVDLDYVKCVMQNDFQYFAERGIHYNEKADPLSANLFALGGARWRKLRTNLTPTFTSGKMKQLFDTLVECTIPMINVMDEMTNNNREVDIKELFARYTTDVIGSCAFGLDCNSFKSPDAEFRKCGKKILEQNVFRQFLIMLCFSLPAFGDIFNIRIFDKVSTQFFLKVVKDAVYYRKTNNIKRQDFLQLLIELKTDENQQGDYGSSLTIEEIAAQCMLFFLAGFETSSTTMTFCLFELAKNQALQKKVKDEISDVLSKHDGKITYDSIMNMKYMTQVIEETLRMYPPLSAISRKCVKDYRVADTDVIIEKGTPVLIPIYGLHHDPDFFPDPETFDPDRFLEENKKKRHPFAYIPFGEGPRLCIGLRFGMMQIKVGLTVLLRNYIFSLNKKTPSIVKLSPGRFTLTNKELILLDSKRSV